MPSASAAARTAKIFESYVTNVWPVHRRLVRNTYSRRCKRCAASERMIPLRADGLCEECACHRTPDADSRSADDAASMNDVLQSHQGVGQGDYDALVCFSGGKDSSYLVRRVRDEFPEIRLLAFTIDNGFMSPVARNNVNRLAPLLDVDHVFVRPRRSLYVKLFRYGLTHLNDQGGYGTVDFSDGEFMLDNARRIAAEKRIPLILCGYSRYQVQDGLGLESFESPAGRERADRTHVAGMSLDDIFGPDEIVHWWHGSAWPQDQVARLLFPLYAWDLDEEEIKRKARAWGLLSKKEQSPIVTNHELIPLLGIVDVHNLGYSSYEIEFCRMIREGKADRQHWQHVFEFLEYTARTGMFVREATIDLLAGLDLTLDDVGIVFDKRRKHGEPS